MVLVVMCVSLAAIRYNLMQWHFGELFSHQLEKLHDPRPIDVLLIGDSSLGNGVDARQWSRDLKQNVVSLSLTGAYGLGGSLNMIRRARHHDVSVIVVVQAVDMMTRAPIREGNIYTAESLADIGDVRPLDFIRALANWDILSRIKVRKTESAIDAGIRKFDYMPQAAPLPTTRSTPPQASASASSINSDNVKLVRAIADACRQLRTKCFYMHGPIVETFCTSSHAYMARVLDIVEDEGLSAIRHSVCLPWEDVGDAVDHVIPGKKEFYSAMILRAVKPHLDLAKQQKIEPR